MNTPHVIVEHRSSVSVDSKPAWRIILLYVVVFVVMLPVFLVVTGLRIDEILPVAWQPTPLLYISGWICLAGGIGMMAGAMGQLWHEGQGLPISHLPPRRFVATGLYRYVRHPIYIGFTLAFLGIAVILPSFWMLFFCVPLLLIGWINYVVFYEEPVLIERFGHSYLQYRERVDLFGLAHRLPWPKQTLNRLASGITSVLTKVASRTVLYQRGRFILVTYGALIVVGSLLMMVHTVTLMLAQGLSMNAAAVFIAIGVLSSMLLARIFWWLGFWRSLIHEPLFGIRRVGFISWGALFGLLLVSVFHAWFYERSLLLITDVLVVSMFIAYAFGRIGCLTYGCCYGIPSHNYGVRYESMQAKVLRECGTEHRLRHPTQIYSSLHGVVLFVVLNLMLWAGMPLGGITAFGFMLYAIGRAEVEWFRDRKRYFGLFTGGHIGCLFLFFLGWGLLFVVDTSTFLSPWSGAHFVDSLKLLPLILVLGVVVLLVMGSHWKQIGTW